MASGPGGRDRAWLTTDGVARRAAVHAAGDLPHLAVESAFGVTDGLWAELAAGSHAEAGLDVTARDPGGTRHRRIVSARRGRRPGRSVADRWAPPRPWRSWMSSAARRAANTLLSLTWPAPGTAGAQIIG